MTNYERELNWDEEIAEEGGNYEPLPEGDYRFTVSKVERARSQGKGKLPPCNMAKVTIAIHGAENDREVTVNLVLHSSLEWKLSQFFLAVGMKRHGEPLRMNWTGAVGKTGSCHVSIREYKSSDGGQRFTNDISKFYAYDEVVNTVVQKPARPSYAQQSYAQPPVQAGSWKQGQF